VRDLWAKQDLGKFTGTFSTDVPKHGAVLVKVH
jgi:Alpha galactosidase C-terminal beta sandwich domain